MRTSAGGIWGAGVNAVRLEVGKKDLSFIICLDTH